MASLIEQDDLRKSYRQTFFLDPQEKDKYVFERYFQICYHGRTFVNFEEQIETKVTIDDQVGRKPSITLNEKEKSIVEMAPDVENEAPIVIYASM
ncbi:hypothetical protein HAX54_046486, partial [Datura stramonium]|nr:hypothetical protein [Datura stramonium]